MFTEEIRNNLRKSAIVAVLVIDRVEDAVPVAKALLAGGINTMELTLRTDAAIPSLKAIKENVPEMFAGIGTILTTEQVDEVVEAGAAFGVAPGMNEKIIKYAQEKGLPFAPGVMTPSEVEKAIELGCRTLKFFPAESSGGLKHLNNISAPYKHLGLDFIPLGGLSKDNMETYLTSPLVSALGGSWLAKADVIKAQDWDQITKNAKEAMEIVAKIQAS